MKSFFAEFKKFITRGNVLDMAVGVVVGSAFTAIVNSLVKDILNPIIGIVTGGIDFSELKIVLKPATEEVAELAIRYGVFINAIIQFILIALVLFIIVKSFNKLNEKKKKEEEAKKAAAAAEAALCTCAGNRSGKRAGRKRTAEKGAGGGIRASGPEKRYKPFPHRAVTALKQARHPGDPLVFPAAAGHRKPTFGWKDRSERRTVHTYGLFGNRRSGSAAVPGAGGAHADTGGCGRSRSGTDLLGARAPEQRGTGSSRRF